MFDSDEVLQLIIISIILMTLMLDLGIILKGEIRYKSLSGIKALITVHSLYAPRLYLLVTVVKIVRNANR